MKNQYETVVIFTPILSEDEAKKQVAKYKDLITEAGGEMVAEEHWGLKQLAYPIQNKTTGIYHIYEYKVEGEFINTLEVNFRRDENVIRFFTMALDKHSIDYNERKRNGEIGRKAKAKAAGTVEIVEGADQELAKADK